MKSNGEDEGCGEAMRSGKQQSGVKGTRCRVEIGVGGEERR